MSSKVASADHTETTKTARRKTKVAEPVVVPQAAPAPVPTPVVVPEPVEVEEVEEVVEEVVEAPKRRLTVAKGSVTIATTRKSTRKSPTRKTTPTRKTPAKKTTTKRTTKSPVTTPRSNSRSPSRSPATSPRTGGRTVKVTKKAAAKKTTKPRRPHNTRAAPIDFSGLGIGPAKVKKVLMHTAFNPVEHAVRLELIKAENKPVRPKPTEKDPDPAMPEQGPQVPIEKLPKHVLEVVRAAERAHMQSLTEDYEHSVVSAMSDVDKKAYQEARKKAQESDNFDLRTFNTSYNKKFYAGFDEYCKENDSYALGRVVKDKKGVERERFNQWSRAMALVNKVCLRLSNGVRDILACYLDNLVIQYARNGIVNCIAEEHSNLQLRHALNPSEGFEERVPIDAFARTLDGYQLAVNWIESCQQTREEVREIRKKVKKGEVEGDRVVAELPEYPDPKYDENFEGYVVEICRSVRMQMASEQKSAVEKAKYHNIKISEYFKKFCSIIIYESILRIGAVLREVVQFKDVKTVNEALMYHALRQVSNVCGPAAYEPIRQDMETRIRKFRVWCNERRDARRAKRNADAEEDEEDEDADLEETVAEEDGDEVVAEELEDEEGDEASGDEEGEEVEVEYE